MGQAKAKRVLIVEDEPHIVESLSFLLAREGYDVVTEGDGRAAIARAEAAAPDVLILDIMLPGRSGFDILAELRRHPALSATRVLMLSAKGQSRDRAEAEARGADRFMTKPFANTEVVDAVRALLA